MKKRRSRQAFRKCRVLLLMHHYLVPPENTDEHDLATVDWRTEYDVLSTLRKMGHDVRTVGIKDDLHVIRDAVHEFKPHIAFNLMENFNEVGAFDQNVVSYLEVLGVPYTGCNPRGLMLSRDKALSKALLAYHRIPIAPFAVYRRGTRVRRPKKLQFPLFVKPLGQDGSIGISQASVVENEEQFQERVRFVHEKVPSDSIVEHYIEGREIYVGVLGNHRLQVFPPWELHFKDMGQSRAIATDRVKWSQKYQEKHGITTGPAESIPPAVERQLPRLCKRIYRTLDMCGYARIDFRLTEEGKLFVIEVNANPHIAHDEYFAESAAKVGIPYDVLLQRIIHCGIRWRPGRLG